MDIETDKPFASDYVPGSKLLLDVDADLCEDSFKNLKFFCQDVIGSRKLQAMKRGLDVFDELEKLTLIDSENHRFEYLVEMLFRIHRLDLVKRLAVDPEKTKRDYGSKDLSQTQLLPLRILLYDVAESMEESEVQKTIFVLSRKFRRSSTSIKKLKNMQEVFTFLEREQELTADNINVLYEIFENLSNRADLTEKVKQYEKHAKEADHCRKEKQTSSGICESTSNDVGLQTEPEVSRNISSLCNNKQPAQKGQTGEAALEQPVASGTAAPIDQTPPQINSIAQSPEVINADALLPSYKMDAKPRGCAVIISNRNFSDHRNPDMIKLKDRIGTEKDVEELKRIFQKLQFNVDCFEDLRADEMEQKMKEYAKKNHKIFDCLVCCILSHGVSGRVYGIDATLIRIDTLTSYFRASSCPTLAGKPKLFFIQACQGEALQRGYDLESDADLEVVNKPNSSDLDVDKEKEMIPDEADFLLGYATVPGYISYRSRSQGSWYINALVDTLDKYAFSVDLLSIMVKVNQEVGRPNANVNGLICKQVSAPIVTLTKKLYFR